jgi:trk system potassium uptake protein
VHVVIMGCGRVGSSLAASLDRLGHEVAVIDKDRQAFRRLSAEFSGRQVVGQGFHREVLVEAGVERAQAFAAVSSGDNSNIISARLARETFGIARVVARIYDAKRAAVYERLGIPTVATVRWTADQMLRGLLPAGSSELWRDPSGQVALVEVHVDPAWMGHRLSKLEEAGDVRVAYLTRLGEGTLPGADTVLQDGDIVQVMVKPADIARVEEVFAKGPVD